MSRSSSAALLGVALALTVSTVANAATITFIPPNDPTGTVFTTNTNDGYVDGRGDVLGVIADTTIDSVGIFHDLTGITLSYSIFETVGTSGDVRAGQTLLRSGSSVVTTRGLDWIDFAFAPLTLLAGNSYHFEFSFSGNGNQNFFYNNANLPFALGPFVAIDGTHNGHTINFVMPAIRVNAEQTVVPEPATMLLLGAGLSGLVGRRFRNRRG